MKLLSFLSCFFCVFLINASLLLAQDSLNVSCLSSSFYTMNSTWDVEIAGNYAFVGDWDLFIFDISDPTNPTIKKRIGLNEGVIAISLKDNYLYVLEEHTLSIYNVTTPDNMQLVSSCIITGIGKGLDVQANYVYVATYVQGLRIIDATNPANLIELSYYLPEGYGFDIAVRGNYAYFADGNEGLRVINISIPTAPQEIAHLNYQQIGNVSGVKLAGNFAYLSTGYSGLKIVNISNPQNPTLIGIWETQSQVMDVFIVNSYAFLANYTSLSILNISNPSNPQLISNTETPYNVVNVFIAGNYAYLSCYLAGFHIFNISNPFGPFEISSYNKHLTNLISAQNDFVYLSDSANNLNIIDVQNPCIPQEVGLFTASGAIMGIAVANNYLYIADELAGIRILDISNPSNPQQTGIFPDCYPQTLCLAGDYLYFTSSYNFFQVIDISDPANPQSISNFYLTDNVYYYTVQGNYLYLSTFDLRIYDISDPGNPQLISQMDFPGNFIGKIIVRNCFAYVVIPQIGISIVNVSNPATPQIIGSYYSMDNANDLILFETHAFWLNFDTGLHVLDVSNLNNPNETGFYNSHGQPYKLDISDNLAFVSEGRSFNIYDCSSAVKKADQTFREPGKILLEQNFPNPFNPNTSISFTLYEEASVLLNIYNSKGQKIKTLMNDLMQSGQHLVFWDGLNDSGEKVSSGLYFYKISSTQKSITKKMILLK